MLINIVIILFVIWVSIYSLSFGVWTWKSRNKLGAVMVMGITLLSLALPFYILFVL